MPPLPSSPVRCAWASKDLLIEYHDKEWGVPVYDSRRLFEFLVLEGMQAGLNWLTILQKRENYRQAFDGFDPKKIAAYTERKQDSLMMNAGIIRNRLKIASIITNARAYLQIETNEGNFADYIWQFVDGKPIKNHWQKQTDVPATSSVSDAMSKALKSHGFKFVGSTICYAFMQATGMVNDHLVDCFCYERFVSNAR